MFVLIRLEFDKTYKTRDIKSDLEKWICKFLLRLRRICTHRKGRELLQRKVYGWAGLVSKTNQLYGIIYQTSQQHLAKQNIHARNNSGRRKHEIIQNHGTIEEGLSTRDDTFDMKIIKSS